MQYFLLLYLNILRNILWHYLPLFLLGIFLVWMEKGYRYKKNIQPSRCTRIRCSRCDTKKKHPKWSKYKFCLQFFLLYVSLASFNIFIQWQPIGDEIFHKEELGRVPLYPFLFGAALIHLLTFHLFKEYYLHNGPLETNDGGVPGEKRAATKKY